jgi:predicted RNA binding protein YcfA (HicA-like mRNA interferase family)
VTRQQVHNQKSMQRLLEANGWIAATGGKHQVKMIKAGERPITLPMNGRRDYPPGLTSTILREAGLASGRGA